jgi:hypothetical protein
MKDFIPLLIPRDEADAIRRLSARIGGFLGGSARGGKKSRSSRKNIKRAIQARKNTVEAAA